MVTTLIINGCKNGERRAFRHCYEACAPYVYTIVKNYVKDDEMRKDTMQEIFAHIFSSIHKFDENKGKFKSWIAQISINQCINQLRRNKRLGHLLPIEGSEISEQEKPDLNLREIPKEQMQKLLDKMPLGYKTVFLLNMVEGYNHSEIAQIIGTTPETSRSQLTRGLKWLRKNISKELKKHVYGQF